MTAGILIIGDPVNQLNFATDSSLALAEGALELGYNVDWTTAEDIDLLNGTPVTINPLKIESTSPDAGPTFIEQNSKSPIALSGYRKIFIRKDPPFNECYVDLCWFLTQLPQGTVVNSPQSILVRHEKMTPFSLVQAGILPEHMIAPGIISKNPETLRRFASELFATAQSYLAPFKNLEGYKNFNFKIIAKPWRGHAGRGIFSFDSLQDFSTWLNIKSKDQQTDLLNDYLILQPLLPEIFTQGDRRVFIINGKIAFDFVRRPAHGRVEANLAQGGTAEICEMPSHIREISERIAEELKQWGICIAGLDFIGDYLTEVNITSPTGIRTFEQLSGIRISKKIMTELLGD